MKISISLILLILGGGYLFYRFSYIPDELDRKKNLTQEAEAAIETIKEKLEIHNKNCGKYPIESYGFVYALNDRCEEAKAIPDEYLEGVTFIYKSDGQKYELSYKIKKENP